MPARIPLDRPTIEAALRRSKGDVASAAAALKVSTKTLRRRIREDPSLQWTPELDPVWSRVAEHVKERPKRKALGAIVLKPEIDAQSIYTGILYRRRSN